jgi:hypothetical protein
MAGDTAQTIARRSAFKFEEVSAMFYCHQQEARLRREGAFSPSSAGPSRLSDLPEENKPCLKHLTENYSSYGRILRLAASIVELIHRYFPGSVDMLKGDTSPMEGPKPNFLSDSSQHGFSVSLFSQGSKDESIEFGANQAILVRQQAAADAAEDGGGAQDLRSQGDGVQRGADVQLLPRLAGRAEVAGGARGAGGAV